GIRAQIDVLLPRHELPDQRPDLGVHERLAARNRYDRRPALVDGSEALLDAQILPQDLAGVLDLSAARAGEVASEQRLEHEDEGVAPAPTHALLQHVAGDRPHLGQRYAHMLVRLGLTGARRPGRVPNRFALATLERILQPRPAEGGRELRR